MDSKISTETSRIIDAYNQRPALSQRHTGLYAWHRQEVTFSQYRFKSIAAKILVHKGWHDLSKKKCLDVGCGTGEWLRTLLEWEADPSRLHGIDLLPDRIEKAKALAPYIDFRVASAWPIVFPDNSVDLVSAHTVFSSILDPVAREELAKEMTRVLNKEGLILIYDFRISHPKNPDTIGIGKNEICKLFPCHRVKMRTLTLAPPFQRVIAPISPLWVHVLEVFFPFLCTHAFYTITK